MNKRPIALFLAMLPVAAMADVTIYGTVRVGLESNKSYADTASGASIANKTEVNDWTSRIGFKGNEDLGDGLKAIWQVENRLHMDGTGSGDGFATRDSFIGLSGNFGSVRFGRLSDYANSDMELVDPGYYSGSSVGGLASFTRLDGRHNNAVRYDSPTWGGFSVQALWAADETRATVSGDRTNGQFTNLGLSYENSGFFGKYNYGHWGDADKLSTTDSWHRLEAGYNANNIYAVLGFQQIKTYKLANDFYSANALTAYSSVNATNAAAVAAASGKESTLREWAITGGYTFGALTPYLSFAKGQKVHVEGASDIANTGYKQWALGANYSLSKRTTAYASYGNVKWDEASLTTEHSVGVGLIHKF